MQREGFGVEQVTGSPSAMDGKSKCWTGTCEESDAPELCNEVTAIRIF